MNPKNKKVLAGAAVAGVLVTWVPQLVAAGDDAPAPVPLGPAVETRPDAEFGASEGEPSSESTGAVADPTTVVDPATALEQRLGAVAAFLPARSQRDLDVLAAAWSLEVEAQKPPTATDSPDDVSISKSSVDPLAADLAAAGDVATNSTTTPVDPLDAFLAANPLTGVLYGEDLRVANLGASVVREGDGLFGLARVATIGPRWIVLEHGSRHVRVDLVPLTARAKIAATGNSSGITGTTPGVPPGPGSTVVPGPTPASANAAGSGPTAAQDLEALLSGLQRALGTSGTAASTDSKAGSKDPKGTKP